MIHNTCDADIIKKNLSVTGKIWQFDLTNNRDTMFLMQRYGLSEVVASILARRNMPTPEVENFLNPSIKKQLPDPYVLLDMEEAVACSAKAIINQEPIGIFADYDVDGATSSAILRRYFANLGICTYTHIPDRELEGYGPNLPALEKLHKNGCKVVIILDCGTTAHEILEEAMRQGLQIIIIDHHVSSTVLPKITALVNPNRFDQNSSELANLCSAGVAFLYLVGLQRHLRRLGFFDTKPEPNLMQLLDLVALGTVCDVMPLTGLNRAFVTQGLKVMRSGNNIGLNHLAMISGITEPIAAYHLGFILGPRINAGGRVGKSYLGSELLSTQDNSVAKNLSQELNQHNTQRQKIESMVMEQALQQINDENLLDNNHLLVYGDSWHLGVIGIVAGRLKEMFHKPVFVFSFNQENGKGSGRSISGLHLGNLMHLAIKEKIILHGGGHSMAAGASINKNNIARFKDFMDHHSSCFNNSYPVLKIDNYLNISAINQSFWEKLKLLEPYGQGNVTPRFVLNNVKIVFSDIVGENHIRCKIQDEYGKIISGIAFRAVNTSLAPILQQFPSKLLDIAGTLKLDIWNNKENFKFHIEDISLPEA